MKTFEACLGFTIVTACILAPWLYQGLSGGFSRPVTRCVCSIATEAYRQLLGRDFHPLVNETQRSSFLQPMTDLLS